MPENEKSQKKQGRRYPSIYEKAIPIAIGVIVILVVGMLALTVGIATGLITAG